MSRFVRNITFVAVLCGVIIVLLPMQAGATPLNGSFSGDGFATVSFTNLNYCPNGQNPNGANQAGACTPGTGNITLAGGSGAYVGVSGNLNQIRSLSQTNQPVGSLVGSGLPLANWLVFIPAIGTPNISLTLTELLAGTFSGPSNCPGGAPAAGQTCTPAGSAFNLVNQTASTSSATFQIIGNAVDGVPADTTPFVMIFSSQFTVPYQTLLAALSVGGGTGNFSSSYSGSFTATFIIGAPEPMTLSLVGAGLLGLGVLGRRKQRK